MRKEGGGEGEKVEEQKMDLDDLLLLLLLLLPSAATRTRGARVFFSRPLLPSLRVRPRLFPSRNTGGAIIKKEVL